MATIGAGGCGNGSGDGGSGGAGVGAHIGAGAGVGGLVVSFIITSLHNCAVIGNCQRPQADSLVCSH